ncbi:MAG: hypothetical protein HYZ67_07810 [Chlamydiae bacterium]|nr:hypothetical protein [Chlamydiota bacterium]
MNYEDAKICSSCLDIYGFVYSKMGVFYQKCDSKCLNRDLKKGMLLSEKKQKRWDGFDFNEFVTLCYCCGAELLKSGSRWSVWFCEACKKRVLEFNQEMGTSVIPIGRHSLMNGIGLKLEPSVPKIKIEETIDHYRRFGASINHLDQWRKIAKSCNWRSAGLDSGQDVGVIRYLSSVKGLDKEEAFIGMRNFFLK